MAERVALTKEQTEMLRQLRAEYDKSRRPDEGTPHEPPILSLWIEDTRPNKTLKRSADL